MSSGRRELEDEKSIITELGKLLHIAKANEKQRRIIKKSEKRVAAAEVPNEKKVAARKKRSNKNGGSIWLTFSGAFRGVPSAGDEADQEQRSSRRAELSKKKRVAAVASAEAFIASAISQAEEAGLAVDGAPTGQEGADYLREQYLTAADMVKRCQPVGLHMSTLVASVCPVATGQVVALTGQRRAAELDWAMDTITKERTLFTPPVFVSAEGVSTATDEQEVPTVLDEAQCLAEQQHLRIVEPTEHIDNSQLAAEGGVTEDVIPTKCIVKLKGAAKKVTTILSNLKGVSNFKLNLSQLLKKDVLPLLAKGSGDDSAPHTAGTANKQKASGNASPSKQSPATSSKSTGKKGKK